MIYLIFLTLLLINIDFVHMIDTSSKLSLKKIFIFWIPLAATWFMMSVEGPYIAALIARMPEPKFNLAAYGVAFSFALIIEAPIIMIMSASTALVKNMQSFNKLRNFTYTSNLLITLLMLILIIPNVFYFITENLIGLPAKVSTLTHLATTILLPWPGAIGYRRFYQGLLIRNNLTRRVAYGTIIRLASMSLTALFFFLFTDVDGVVVGAAALSVAVTLEALASRLMANEIIQQLKKNKSNNLNPITYKEIYRFYYPLALTSLIGLGVQPFVTFFVGQSKMAIESLAVLPVITSFVFIFRGMGLSFQEVVIALIGEKKEGYIPLKKFGFILGTTLTTVLALFAFTPLSGFWFKTVSGLSDLLSDFASVPLMIMAIFPALTVLISTQRGLLVSSQNTKPVTIATSIEFITIVIALLLSIHLFNVIGAIAATSAFVTGRIIANFYLVSPSKSAAR
jgi:O-antigen/teichoic acid export membrane protein